MSGGKREGAGRPPIGPRLVKVPVGYKLSRWLVDWLRDQDEDAYVSQSASGRNRAMRRVVAILGDEVTYDYGTDARGHCTVRAFEQWAKNATLTHRRGDAKAPPPYYSLRAET